VCFIETGAQHRKDIAWRLSRRYEHLNTYEATYYRKDKNRCFVIRGGRTPQTTNYVDLDERDIIEAVCAKEPFDVIADPCMGRGAVGVSAYRNGRRFLGTELSPARIAVMIRQVHELGGVWHVDGTKFEPQPSEPSAVGADRAGEGERVQSELGRADGNEAPLHLDQT
jgi:hypothetical protein